MTDLPRDPPKPTAPHQHGMPPPNQQQPLDPARLTAWVGGRVQGVGFRWWTRARALELGLAGSARNLGDGRVEVVAQGPRTACAELLALLRSGRSPGRVDGVTERWSQPRTDVTGFTER